MVSVAVRPVVEDGLPAQAPQRSRPAEKLAHWRETTPGRLSSLAAALVVVIALAGLAAAMTAQHKWDSTWDLVEAHEPTAADVQRLYRALSDADVTAARAFLAAGAESEALRTRYEDDLAVAGPTLGLAAVDRSGDSQIAREIGIVGRQLPVYAGLVETARVNNRQGLPVGGAYLREASELMRSEILPAAERIYRIQTERVAAESTSSTGFPFIAAALVLAALAVLIAAQVYVRRVSKRRLNLGLLVATAAIVIGGVWSALGLVVHASHVDAGHQDGTQQVNVLADARIVALQARADELLTLVGRGDGGAHEERFVELAKRLAGDDGAGGMLRQAGDAALPESEKHLDNAITASQTWLKTHKSVRQLDDGGKYDDAVQLAIDEKRSNASAPAFAALDDGLRQAIEAGRQHFVDETVGGARALTLLAVGWIVLALIAVGGVLAGIGQRVREYR